MAHAEMPHNRPPSRGFGQRRVRPARAAAPAPLRDTVSVRPALQHGPRPRPEPAPQPVPPAALKQPPNRVHTAIAQGAVAGVLLLCLLHALSHFI